MNDNNSGLNINDLKQISQMIAQAKSDQQIQQPKTQPKTQPKRVRIQSPPLSENSISENIIPTNEVDNSAQNISDTRCTNVADNVNSDNMYTLMGYVIPKQTLYLLIIFIIIAIGIWYMAADNVKKHKKDEEDE